MNEEKKNIFLKVLIIILVTFITSFLAFYAALGLLIHKLTTPEFYDKKIEKMVKAYEKDMRDFEKHFEEHPFLPQTTPTLVNLVKENNEYKIIVNLKPFEGNADGIDVKIKDNIVSVNGKIEKKSHRGEEIVNFSQSYYLDEKLKTDNITKEKINDKYIITIPFKN